MKSNRLIFLCIILFIRLNSYSQTLVGGIMYNNDTWTAAGNPYYVVMDLTIWPDVTLTIDSGVKVIFKKNFAIGMYGKLNVKGTKSNPVTFNGDSLGVGINVLWQGITALNDTCNINLENAYFSNAEAALNLSRIRGIMFQRYPSVNVKNCLFENNLAAIRSTRSIANGKITRSKFINNKLGIDGTGILAETSDYYQLTQTTSGPGFSIYVENCLFDGNEIAAAGLSFIKKSEFKRNTTAIKFVSKGWVDSSVFSWNKLAIRGHSFIMRSNGFYNNDTGVVIYGEPNPPASFGTVLVNGSVFDKNGIGLLISPNAEVNQIACNRFTRNRNAIKLPAYTYLDNGVRSFPLLTSFFIDNDTAIHIMADSSLKPSGNGFRLVYFNTTDCYFSGGDYYAYNASTTDLNFFHNIFDNNLKSEEDYLFDDSDDTAKGAFNYAEQIVTTLYDSVNAYYYYQYSRGNLVLKHPRFVNGDTAIYFPTRTMKPCSDPSIKHQSKLSTQKVDLGLLVYPNPCNEFLNIHLKNSQVLKVNIFSKEGVLLQSHSTAEPLNEMTIETHQLPQGVYILLLYTSEGIISAKFVKE